MPHHHRFGPAIAAQKEGGDVDHVIAAMAERNHGVVARRDLAKAGVSRHAITHRLAKRRLHVLFPGVYAVGHKVMTADGERMATVLAAGPHAVLSHRAAASHLGLRHSSQREVTIPRPWRRRRGIRVPALVARYPRRAGVATIKAILGDGAECTRSELEGRFLSFLGKAGLPRPEVNAWLPVAGRWIECDCLWRSAGVIVELDGFAAHGTAAAFERDRARDRMLHARGWRLVRVTWRQLHREPEAVARDLRAVLGIFSRDAARHLSL